MLGKINWSGLPAYAVQPSDMNLFQSYMTGGPAALLSSTRIPGVISGGVITVVAGLQVSISAGLCMMPDGTLLSFPALTATLAAASSSNPRIDRIEMSYSILNNTAVVDVSGNPLTLDLLYNAAINVVTGTPAATPMAPAATGVNNSLGLVTVPTSAVTLVTGNISQVVDAGLVISASVFKTGLIRYNQTLGLMQYSNDGIRWQAMSAIAIGAGATWQGSPGAAPLETSELVEKAWLFSQGAAQSADLFVRVPTNYLAGNQIHLKLAHYSPSATNFFHFQTTATLVRRNTDAVTSTTNQRLSTNSDQANALAYQFLEVIYDLTDASGMINAVGVSPGDLILVNLARIAATGTDDTADVRMIPSSTEVIFQ